MAERPDIKFCGLTRPADAELAASLGARYVGVILVGGPRLVTPARASLVFDAARGPERVAVVSLGAPADMAALGHATGADILQLHADPTPELVRALREHWKGGIWAAVRLGGGRVPSVWSQLFGVADAVVTEGAFRSDCETVLALQYANGAEISRLNKGLKRRRDKTILGFNIDPRTGYWR